MLDEAEWRVMRTHPEIGKRIRTNGEAWEMKPRGFAVRVLAPVDGVPGDLASALPVHVQSLS